MEDQRLSFLAMVVAPLHQQPSITVSVIPRLGTRVGKWVIVATTVLVGLNSGIAYMLMLAVMSFNWGVLIAIVLGFGVGYFLFTAKKYEALIVDDTCASS
ncbi:copper transporter 5.1-like [Silene latifolia]|uniref:copper transporter 5.1-like n=1 Tax=Silene latifolia TaxID=37657 RepID=UPI003D771280